MTENWKVIEGHPNYMISDQGRIINWKRGRVLKGTECNGYLRVTLNRIKRYVHILVATSFIPNPENKPEVNHKDKDRKNNLVGNLEWNTFQENCEHGLAKDFKFINPTGTIVDVFNLERFCRENGLDAPCMRRVNQGQQSNHKGWTAWNE